MGGWRELQKSAVIVSGVIRARGKRILIFRHFDDSSGVKVVVVEQMYWTRR